jgi:hypothetical protein
VKYSGLSRNTIKAWLKETSPDGYKYPKRPPVNGKLTPFVPVLLLALEADSRRPKRDRYAIDTKENFEFERQISFCRSNSLIDMRRKG